MADQQPCAKRDSAGEIWGQRAYYYTSDHMTQKFVRILIYFWIPSALWINARKILMEQRRYVSTSLALMGVQKGDVPSPEKFVNHILVQIQKEVLIGHWNSVLKLKLK